MRHLGKKKEAQAENNAEKYCSIEYGWSETFIVEIHESWNHLKSMLMLNSVLRWNES